MKLVVALQKETLISQSDPCTRLYILRSGALQAAASEKLLLASSTVATRQTASKMARSSTWKQKMQVTPHSTTRYQIQHCHLMRLLADHGPCWQLRMIERPGDVICCRSPYEPPQPLPFQITSLKRSTLVAMHMQVCKMLLQLHCPMYTHMLMFDVHVHAHPTFAGFTNCARYAPS